MSVEEMFERLEAADNEALKEIKLWLFKESIRLRDEKHELEMDKKDFLNERENTREENRRYEEHLATRTRQLSRQEELIAQKHEVIKRGFEELDRDRQALNAREVSIRAREAQLEERIAYTPDSSEVNDVLFRGADNILLIKKRYKDLMKMFHPDCLGGDTEMVKSLNRTYDRLLKECDPYGKRRRA
jgi:curved DNA-binding protein CbpA